MDLYFACLWQSLGLSSVQQDCTYFLVPDVGTLQNAIFTAESKSEKFTHGVCKKQLICMATRPYSILAVRSNGILLDFFAGKKKQITIKRIIKTATVKVSLTFKDNL